MGRQMSKLPRAKLPVTLALQDVHVRHHFPNFTCRIKRGKAIWSGALQPRLSSPAYKIQIEYQFQRVPKVYVVWPKLIENAPHRYQDGTLCLYWPKEWQWHAYELIATTILPWAAHWLYFYELWLDTGQWLGPSSHRTSTKSDKDS